MDKNEFIKVYGKDLTEMKITSVLNYHAYKDMDMDALAEFIARDVNEKATRFVHPDWTFSVHVTCEYVVIDSHYQKHDTVTAQLEYSHRYSARCDVSKIVINSKT